MIPISHTGIDENTVMIRLRNATLADGAVFRPRRLRKLAGATFRSGMEERVVVGVESHVMGEGLRGDVAWIGGAREVEEDERKGSEGYGD